MTMIPITAYRIELIAGFTFSSFPPESMSISPHQIIKSIAQSHATNTTREIATRIISLAVYDASALSTAHAAETSLIKVISIERKIMGFE